MEQGLQSLESHDGPSVPKLAKPCPHVPMLWGAAAEPSSPGAGQRVTGRAEGSVLGQMKEALWWQGWKSRCQRRGASGLAEPRVPGMSWGRRMSAVTLVAGGDHPEVTRTVAFSQPPGSGKTARKGEARFAREGFFCSASFGPALAKHGTTGNGLMDIFCSAQPFPEPFQPGPAYLQG